MWNFSIQELPFIRDENCRLFETKIAIYCRKLAIFHFHMKYQNILPIKDPQPFLIGTICVCNFPYFDMANVIAIEIALEIPRSSKLNGNFIRLLSFNCF